MKTQAFELCIIIVYKPEAVVWAAYVPSSVVAAAVVPPTVVPFISNISNNNNNCDANTIITMVSVKVHFFFNTRALELRGIKVYIPEAVVGTAVVPSSVVAEAVVSPKLVSYNNNN